MSSQQPPDDATSGDIDLGSTGDLRLEQRQQPLTVELMPDGRLRAPRQRTREMLRMRLHKAELLPTGPEWALFRNLERLQIPVRPEPGQRQVILAGSLGEESVSLIDAIGFIASGLHTGVLGVYVDDIELSVYFSSGDVVWASSTAPEDSIGEFLVRRGKITPSQLAALTREAPERIGRACVEHGYIAPHDLWNLVQAQLTELFDRIIATERGVWTFARVDSAQLASSQINFSTQGLLMDALRKLDEMRVFREVVRSASSLIAWSPDAASIPDLPSLVGRVAKEAQEDVRMLVPHMVGTVSIQDLIRMSGKSEFFVTRAVFHMHRARMVGVRDQTPSLAPVPSSQISKTAARDVIVVYAMAIGEIFNELDVDSGERLRKSADGFLTDPAVSYASVLREVILTPKGKLDVDSLLAALATRPVGLQELSEALSELLFFLLFEATEMLGPRRRDDLARRVRMIHGMLRLPGDSGGVVPSES